MKRILSVIALLSLLINSSVSQNKLDIDFRTGDDNLEVKKYQLNPVVRIKINGREDIVKENINNGQEWPNHSMRRVTIPLPDGITAEDLKEIQVTRSGLHDREAYYGTFLNQDNWTLKGITVTARLVVNGTLTSVEVLNLNTRGNVYRFVYNGTLDNPREGIRFKAALAPTTIKPVSNSSGNITFTAEFGTGGDNLEGGSSNNVNMIIRFRNAPRPLSVINLNKGAKWENNKLYTIYNKEIPNSAGFNIDDIEKVELRHTGGGGTFADNWNLDKFKLTINKGDQAKVLVDEAGTPIHRFTGNSRKKEFLIQ